VRAAFGDDAILDAVDGITTMTCSEDGAHGLHRVLATLGDLGLELVEIRSLGPVPGTDSEPGGGFRVSIQGALTVDHITCLDDPSEVRAVRATDDIVTLVARDSAELSRLVQVVRDNGLALIGVERR
jgi:hypothetical protein